MPSDDLPTEAQIRAAISANTGPGDDTGTFKDLLGDATIDFPEFAGKVKDDIAAVETRVTDVEIDVAAIPTDGSITDAKVASAAAIALSKLNIGGTPNGSKFLRDDGSWQTPAGGGSFTTPPTADAIRYISGSGDDANDGLTEGTAKRTISSAYTSLPSSGGTIYLAPGRFDVGSGFNISRQKIVSLVGLVKPTRSLPSTSTTPLSVVGAVIYTSASAVSMIKATAGTAASRCDGLQFRDLIFELSSASTITAIDIDTCMYGIIDGCFFFADKTTGPAAVEAQGFYIRASAPGTYGGNDCSWWTVTNNVVFNMALGTFGNSSGTQRDCDHQICDNNVCLGLAHTNLTALPAISFYGATRSCSTNNELHAYNRGLFCDTCTRFKQSNDGGEFVDIFTDLVDTHDSYFMTGGISYAQLGSSTPIVAGALCVRADAFTKFNTFILPNCGPTSSLNRNYPAWDDVTTPSCDFGSTDNIILAPRSSQINGVPWGGTANTFTPGDTLVYIGVTDQTLSSTTTPTLDQDIVLPLTGDGTEYWVEMFWRFTSANATMDCQVGWDCDAAVDMSWGIANNANTSFANFGPQTTAGVTQALTNESSMISVGTPTGSNTFGFIAQGWVTDKNDANPSNFTPRFAQVTSNAGTLVRKANSFLRVTVIRPG